MNIHVYVPQYVVPDLPLPGLTVLPPHSDPQLMHGRQLSHPAAEVYNV